jgi:putative transposase
MTTAQKITFIEKENPLISIVRQCEMLEINRSQLYYKSCKSEERSNADNHLLRRIDEIYTTCPFYGTRRIRHVLNTEGIMVSRKKIKSIMEILCLNAIYPKKRLSIANIEHKKYPYLLTGLKINRPNQVWATDITYIRMPRGFAYLTVIMDWFSRYVISYAVSNTLESEFCINALQSALAVNKCEIFNSDQGSQYTSAVFTDVLKSNEIKISMDGKGRVYDNIFIERLWRTVKYEEIYLKEYESITDLRLQLTKYFDFYNNRRPHQSLNYKTPAELYFNLEIKKAC